MKIILFTNIFPPTSGGSASDYDIFTTELIKRKNIEKITVISRYIKLEKIVNISNDNKLQILRLLLDYKSNNYFFIKVVLFLIQNIQCFIIGMYFRLKSKYDLIQTHSDMLWAGNRLFIQPGTLFLSKSARVTVLDIRDKLSMPSKDLNYSHYLVNSEYCLSMLSKVLDIAKVSLIYCPFKLFNREILEEGNKYLQQIPYVAFLGNISKNKGIFELLDAIKILNQNRKDSIKLLFCGELNDPIEEIPDNCIYLGPLDYLNAMKLLIGANLLILPSKSESHPRVIIESIIYDIPFLTTRGVAEIEKYFPDNILDNTEPEYLAQRIKDCFDDCDASLSTSYPIHIHQIDNVIDQIYKVYDNLIS